MTTSKKMTELEDRIMVLRHAAINLGKDIDLIKEDLPNAPGQDRPFLLASLLGLSREKGVKEAQIRDLEEALATRRVRLMLSKI